MLWTRCARCMLNTAHPNFQGVDFLLHPPDPFLHIGPECGDSRLAIPNELPLGSHLELQIGRHSPLCSLSTGEVLSQVGESNLELGNILGMTSDFALEGCEGSPLIL